jgi:hypothetical protein
MTKPRSIARILPAAAAAALFLRAAPAPCQPAQPTAAVDPEAVYHLALDDFKAGKYADACAKFIEARRQKPDSTPALQGIAQACDKAGRTATAWAKYRQLSVELKSAGDAARAESASARAAELSRILSALIITPASLDTPGLVIRLDREEVARALLGTSMPVDPGQHIIEATADGYQVWQTTITVGDNSDAKEIKIPALVAKPAQWPGQGGGAPPQGPSAVRPASYAVGGVGVAGLLVGGIFGGLALSAKSTLTRECPGNVCTSTSAQDDHAAATTKALISTIGIGVGTVALVTGIVLFVVSRPASSRELSPAPRASLVPTVGPGGGGLAVAGAF